jgi:hypothetical protein
MAALDASQRRQPVGGLSRPNASNNGGASAVTGAYDLTEVPSSPVTGILDRLRDAAAVHGDDLIWPESTFPHRRPAGGELCLEVYSGGQFVTWS